MKNSIENFSPAWLTEENDRPSLPLEAFEATLIARRHRALSNPIRLEIVVILGLSPTNVSSLAAALDESQATISKHLRILKAAEFIDSTASGSERIYHLTRTSLSRAILDMAAAIDD